MSWTAEHLRRNAICGTIPAPLLRTRGALIGGTLPPRMTLPVIAWASYGLAKPELRVMKSLVDPRRKSVDVGANIGVHTYFLARWSQHVYAYEPNPALRSYLQRSCARNVTVSTTALSDRAGQATLTIPLVSNQAVDPYASLDERVARLSASDGETQHHVVETRPLDVFGHADIGFIKIDVEGHEAAVIAGATETLHRERPTLLVEIVQRHNRGEIRDVFDQVLRLGYEGYFLLGGKLIPIAQFSVEAHQRQPMADHRAGPFVENFVFTPMDR